MSEVAELRGALRLWPDVPFSSCSGIVGRLAAVLEEQRTSLAPSISPDIQALVRQVFYREWLQGGEQSVEVPEGKGWPTASRWINHGFEVRNPKSGTLWLEVQPWKPQWLEGGTRDPFAGSTSEEARRNNVTTPTDPFVRDVTGYETYTSYAQRDAVRSYIMAKPGSVVLVTLPTGSGKSLLAQLPVLMGPPEGHLSIVIVPTVSLAIDQEAQFRLLASYDDGIQSRRLAYHSGLSDSEKSAIRSKMEAGKQRILFTSPEAVCGSLGRVLQRLNSRGHLANFVIDEVHLLAQWGDGFRPAYQQLAGVWRSLRKEAPSGGKFKTLLMTATLTDGVMDTLHALFDHEHAIQAVSAVGLRPEPEYWFKQAKSSNERQEWVVEAISHAPRPLILYVTQVCDCRDWCRKLRRWGYQRIEAFHGKTQPSDRERIINEWRSDKIDIVVATSAFGVGIDKGNIRAVLHACVPETIDRYYQEVGRGGRDGSASTSLVLWTEKDLETSRGLAIQKTIGPDKGLKRWEAMLATRISRESFIEIDLNAIPEHMHTLSEEDRSWNLRTIILMARARFLELGPPASVAGNGSDAELPVEGEVISPSRVPMLVRILDPDHRSPDAWKDKLELYRENSLAYYSNLWGSMRDILLGRSEVSEALKKAYTLKQSWFSYVSKECAGCPTCRNSGLVGMSSPVYASQSVDLDVPNISDWYDKFPGADPTLQYVVLGPNSQYSDRSHLAGLIALAMTALGIQELGFAGEVVDDARELTQRVYDHSKRVPFVVNWGPVHRTTYCDYTKTGKISCLINLSREPIPLEFCDEPRALHLILIPFDAHDAVRTDRRCIDVNQNWRWVEDFREALVRWEF